MQKPVWSRWREIWYAQYRRHPGDRFGHAHCGHPCGKGQRPDVQGAFLGARRLPRNRDGHPPAPHSFQPAAGRGCVGNRGLSRWCRPFRRHSNRVLGPDRVSCRRGHCVAACLARSQSRSLVHLWPPAAPAYLGGGLCLRRQRSDLHQFLCRAENLPGPARLRRSRLVRVLGLSAFHRDGGERVSSRKSPSRRSTPNPNGMSISG